jgi:Xaa-Pro aminopeptidase
MRIPRSEYEARWQRVQQACRDEGLDAIVAVSRGGAVPDSYADVMWLANHYNAFVYCADLPRWWVGRSHPAVVIPAQGEPTLLVDIPDWNRDLVALDDVRIVFDVPKAIADVLAEKGARGGRVGFAGGHAMLVSPYRRLLEELPGTELVPADDLMERLRAVKSQGELQLLREASEIGSRVMQAMMEAALQPGITEADAVAAGMDIAVRAPVSVYDVAVASGPHSMNYTRGRLPSWTDRVLEEGDFFHVDTYGAHEGYLYDFSRTCVVGGKPRPEQLEVLEAAIDSVEAGVAAIAPGVKARDVCAAVRGVLEDRGMTGDGLAGDIATTPALTSAFPGHGHAIGFFWEGPWLLLDEEQEVQADTCFGIETMAGRAGLGSAKFEQNVIVTDGGVELITSTSRTFW